MKRKVIQIAGSTQLVSLPRKWALAHGIKKGDELEVEEKGTSIIIRTEKERTHQRCTLNLRSMEHLKRRTICAAYLKGYDELEVQYDSPEYIQQIQSSVLEFPGYEIVQQGKTSCLIKQISSPTQKEFDNVLNRLFLLLHDTGNKIIEAVKQRDIDMLKSIEFREVHIDKFANFCRRLLNKNGHPEAEKTSALYFILTSLEFLGDEYKELAKTFAKDLPSKEVVKVISEINTLFDSLFRLFHSFSKQKAIELTKKRKSLVKEIELLLKKEKQPVPYYHLRRVSQIIFQIAEATLLLNV